MVGTDLTGRGGIRTVVRGYIAAGLFERIDCAYVTTHRFGSRWRKLHSAVSGWARAAAALCALDAPLVHIHISFGASFWRKSVICLLARLARRPYLLHVHGDFADFYAQCSPPAQRMVRDILGRAALVITVCAAWRLTIARICPQARTEVLTNAVPLPALAELHRDEDRAPTLLFLGDLIPAKGIFDLVRAFALIAARWPRLRLIFGGVGASEEIRALALELGLERRIECAGWLDVQRKHAALAGATIFVLPSHVEGMPMSLLEAMAWGLPVIATRVGGIPEVITSAVDGLLLAPRDIDGLAAALARLMAEPGLRQRLGRGARERIASGFPLDGTVERLIAIYRRFGLEPHPPRARHEAALGAAAGNR